jgi:glycosyltransferase involved in cell wall biosynthesis
MNRRHVCIVVPVHDEAENITEFVNAVQQATVDLSDWTLSLLFVDDGSTDATFAMIEKVRRQSSIPVGCVQFSRNFGHQAALEAGLLHAMGDAVLTMDGDLQHPPSEIPRMLAALEPGIDIVQMIRDRSVGGRKGLFSRLFYAVFSRWAHSDIIPDASDFRLLTRRVVDVLERIPERDKFLRGLLPTLGFKQNNLFYHECGRHAGTSSYTFFRSLKLGRKALFDFSTIPLRLVFVLGLALAAVSFVAGVGHILKKLISSESVEPGFTDIIVTILFLSGCILVSIGIIGRYMMLILDQVRGRPPYVITAQLPPEAVRDHSATTPGA